VVEEVQDLALEEVRRSGHMWEGVEADCLVASIPA